MTQQRRGGIIQLAANGVLYECKGAFTANLGRPKRKPVIGSDGVHGFSEEPQVAFIEGKITDRGDLDTTTLTTMTDATVTLLMANGKTVALANAWYAGEGTVNTEEGELDVKWESGSAEEIA